MEEEYILVSKDEMSKLKQEIARLKTELETKPKVSEIPVPDTSEIVSKLIEVLHTESQKERELILQNLDEIKELNKSTLDNLLTKTQKLDGQLEDMVDTISTLVDSLSNVLDKFSSIKDLDKLVPEKIIEMKNNNSETEVDSKILEKLDEIDLFLKNLRILLSYVKPNDFRIES